MKHILFVCGRNRFRSPTAECVFADHPNVEVASAGVSRDADAPLSADLVTWADIIFVMEEKHRDRLSTQFRPLLGKKRIICLDIPDKFGFMNAELVRILKSKVTHYLG